MAGFVSRSAVLKVVILIPDGLHADAMSILGESLVPNLWRFRMEGVWTDRACTLADQSVTTPCQTSIQTGRPMLDVGPWHGHRWTTNAENPWPGPTIHDNAGEYVPSIWDVAHDAGLSTALYFGKQRGRLMLESWFDEISDGWVYGPSQDELVIAEFLADVSTFGLCDLTLLHFGWPDERIHQTPAPATLDPAGHYMQGVIATDARVGQALAVIDLEETTVILTSDHGFTPGTRSHEDYTDPDCFFVPFAVMGAGVTQPGGTDLYAANPTRVQPVTSNPPYMIQGPDGPKPNPDRPIRNAEAAILALWLMGLPSIAGAMFQPVVTI